MREVPGSTPGQAPFSTVKNRNLKILEKCVRSRGWFRSTDLWVMGPARFLCATLLREAELKYGMNPLLYSHSDVVR